MAKQVINNGDAGSVARGKINDNFTENYDAINNLGVWTTWTPGFTGFSVNPSSVDATYIQQGSKLFIVRFTATVDGTSNSTSFTITGLPVTARLTQNFPVMVVNSGALSVGRLYITGGTNVATLSLGSGALFTSSGAKNAFFTITVEGA